MKKALVITGDGIGNAIQSTPAVTELLKQEYEVHMWIPNSPTDCREMFLGVGCCRKVWVGSESPGREDAYDLVTPNWMMLPRAKTVRLADKGLIKPGLAPIGSGKSESHAHWVSVAPQGKHYGAMPPTWCRAYVNPEDVFKGKRKLAMHMGSKTNWPWKYKRYPRYHEVLVRLLLSDEDLHIYVFGAGQDETFLGYFTRDGVIADHQDRIHHRFDLPLGHVAGQIGQCDAFLGNDAGMAHVAAAMAIPTAIVYGPTQVRKNLPPYWAIPITNGPMECRPCQPRKVATLLDGSPCRAECLTKLHPGHVADVAYDLMERKR